MLWLESGLLLLAIVMAALGGEWFLRGVLALSQRFALPKLLVATTLVALATSSPELMVSTLAAWQGQPEIGLGDALGSNVTNIALLAGLALLLRPLAVSRAQLGGDYLLALLLPLLTVLMLWDGELSRLEAGLLLTGFVIWLWRSWHAPRATVATQDEAANPGQTWHLLAGLALLVLAGRCFVSGAAGIAAHFGVSAYLIGVTIVALGTSLPELVTVLLARWRGEDEIGIGTLLGSNLFNGMAIVGTAALIHPMMVSPAQVMVTLASGVLALLLLLPGKSGLLGRGRGISLLLVYAVAMALAAALV